MTTPAQHHQARRIGRGFFAMAHQHSLNTLETANELSGAESLEPQSPRPQPAGTSSLPSASPFEVAHLISLFEMHGGFLTPEVLNAERINADALVARGLLTQSPCKVDGICYLIGEELRKAVQ